VTKRGSRARRRILIVSFILSGWWVVDHAFEEREECPFRMRFFGEVEKLAAVRTRDSEKLVCKKLFYTTVEGSRCSINTVIHKIMNRIICHLCQVT
jgi:hypothetical protein